MCRVGNGTKDSCLNPIRYEITCINDAISCMYVGIYAVNIHRFNVPLLFSPAPRCFCFCTMKLAHVSTLFLSIHSVTGAVIKRDTFKDGQPIDGKGKGAPILGMPSHFLLDFASD